MMEGQDEVRRFVCYGLNGHLVQVSNKIVGRHGKYVLVAEHNVGR